MKPITSGAGDREKELGYAYLVWTFIETTAEYKIEADLPRFSRNVEWLIIFLGPYINSIWIKNKEILHKDYRTSLEALTQKEREKGTASSFVAQINWKYWDNMLASVITLVYNSGIMPTATQRTTVMGTIVRDDKGRWVLEGDTEMD
jgi:hypothetical protein